MEWIDLRSDTVTKPDRKMLEFMMEAPVGDDVFGEDPTVKELEEYAANLFRKEAGLFCPSGTMSNQIALRIHTQPGDEVICDFHSHIYHYETGGMAVHSGLQPKLIHTTDGILYPELIEPLINPEADWLTRTSLVVLENTCNRAGGTYYTLDNLRNIYQLTRKYKLKLHIDGARIFNAIVENTYTTEDIGLCCDTISVCLSKGLGAPAGTLLLGSREDIRRARKIRKQMGGGMRQTGILAAAGLYALKNNIPHLKKDHEKAKRITGILQEMSYVKRLCPAPTNIIIFEINDDISMDEFENKLLTKKIKIARFGKQTIRMVTHRDISDEMTENVIKSLSDLNF